MAKSLGSTYRSGSTWSWRKVRHSDTVDAELIGLVGPAARPRALLVRPADGSTLTTTPRLTPAQARQVGALVTETGGALTADTDPEHGPVLRIARPPAVELRQVAGRHETASFVRLRGEGV
ncbi:hypothetical protein [Streptomyces hydrogenans]|uniref:hypothetical protein n=1 Tax=Streptomyces hydrogenans TaxID=1873719 RepID=UPI0036A4309F